MKTNKICFEKETHDPIGNTTMTMSTTRTTTTTANRVSYYRLVFSPLPSIPQQSKRGNVIQKSKRRTRAQCMRERRINKSRKSNPIIFTISKIRFLSSHVPTLAKNNNKKSGSVCRVHCVWSTNGLTLRLADGRAYAECDTPSCGGKGAKRRRWSAWNSYQTYQIDTHLSTLTDTTFTVVIHLRRCRHRRRLKCAASVLVVAKTNVFSA